MFVLKVSSGRETKEERKREAHVLADQLLQKHGENEGTGEHHAVMGLSGAGGAPLRSLGNPGEFLISLF